MSCRQCCTLYQELLLEEGVVAQLSHWPSSPPHCLLLTPLHHILSASGCGNNSYTWNYFGDCYAADLLDSWMFWHIKGMLWQRSYTITPVSIVWTGLVGADYYYVCDPYNYRYVCNNCYAGYGSGYLWCICVESDTIQHTPAIFSSGREEGVFTLPPWELPLLYIVIRKPPII